MQNELLLALEDLSPLELAVFLFTVDGFGNEASNAERPQIVPTKDAIIWALCAYEFVRYHGYFYSEDIEFQFKRIVANKLARFIGERREFLEVYRRSMSPYPVPLARYDELFGFRRGIIKTKSLHEIGSVEKSLEMKGLIVDPFGLEVPGAVIAVLGFIPYSFSIKTEKGREKCLKIGAWLWDFDYKSKEHGYDFNFKFNIAKIADLIKKHIAIATKQSDESKDG
jgi:hypothetical protein